MALRFILDHAQDLTERPGSVQEVAMELQAIEPRVALSCPAPATLDRRIDSWSAFHRMRNRVSPFSVLLFQQARQKARRANARPRIPKSPRPITLDVLEALLASCDDSRSGIRDRAMLMLAFASGGRRPEVSALNVEDISRDDFAAKGPVWIRRLETKTTRKDHAEAADEGPSGAGAGALAGGSWAFAGDQRRVLGDPTVERRVIDDDPTFGQYLFKIAAGHGVANVGDNGDSSTNRATCG